MNDTDVIRRLMLAVERLERAADHQATQAQHAAERVQHAQAAAGDLAAIRSAEEAQFRQAMTRLFQDHQSRTELALRPAVRRAWQWLAAIGLGLALLVFGFLLLLGHEYRRLQDARARADAAEVSAEVQRAAQQVEITSCGGRPCIRLDANAPVWKSRDREYVLVDGAPR